MELDTNIVMHQFLELGKKLVVEHGKTHRQLMSEMTAILISESLNITTQKVIYNDTFGGFNLSSGFLLYLKDRYNVTGISKHTHCKDKRSELIPFMFDYGRYILDSSTFLRGIVHIYESLHIELPIKQSRKSDIEFAEAIQNYGDESEEIWYYQPFYDIKIIQYLISNGYKTNADKRNMVFHPFDKTWISVDTSTMSFDAVMNFGLVCSSGEFSFLRIKEVPALVDFDIINTQGREDIKVLGWTII